jgi:hypothetical protein
MLNRDIMQGMRNAKGQFLKGTLPTKPFEIGNQLRLGKTRTLDEIEKIVRTKTGVPNTHMQGDKHWNWKGGKTKERQRIMNTLEYKQWRTAVYERDKYTCQLCQQVGGELNADHIKKYADYPELRFDISNGRTLCLKCHIKTGNFGKKKEC